MKKEKKTDWIYYVFVFLSAIAVFTYIACWLYFIGKHGTDTYDA